MRSGKALGPGKWIPAGEGCVVQPGALQGTGVPGQGDGGGAEWSVGVGGGGKGWFCDIRTVGHTMPQYICPLFRDIFIPSGFG